jgi:hypothetical protein
VSELRFPFGIATVTAKGICYQDQLYSSPEAISGRWFETAALTGGCPVVVIHDISNMDRIYIVNAKENTMILCEAIRLQSENGNKLDNYFQSIQRLQKARRAYKRNRRNNKNNLPTRNRQK